MIYTFDMIYTKNYTILLKKKLCKIYTPRYTCEKITVLKSPL